MSLFQNFQLFTAVATAPAQAPKAPQDQSADAPKHNFRKRKPVEYCELDNREAAVDEEEDIVPFKVDATLPDHPSPS